MCTVLLLLFRFKIVKYIVFTYTDVHNNVLSLVS